MTDDRSLERAARSWLEIGPTTAPDRAVDAALLRIQSTPQERDLRIPWRLPEMLTPARVAMAAVIGVLAIGGTLVLITRPNQLTAPPGPNPSSTPAATPSSTPEATRSTAASVPPPSPVRAASSPALPSLRMPGTRASAPGLYGWEGSPHSQAGMHRVVEGRGEVAAMTFSVGHPDCSRPIPREGAIPVRVAGLDGRYIEPFTPPITFAAKTQPTTRAYALAVDDGTLCVYVTKNPKTTDADWAAALQILETIRAEHVGDSDRIRITFELVDGWDVG